MRALLCVLCFFLACSHAYNCTDDSPWVSSSPQDIPAITLTLSAAYIKSWLQSIFPPSWWNARLPQNALLATFDVSAAPNCNISVSVSLQSLACGTVQWAASGSATNDSSAALVSLTGVLAGCTGQIAAVLHYAGPGCPPACPIDLQALPASQISLLLQVSLARSASGVLTAAAEQLSLESAFVLNSTLPACAPFAASTLASKLVLPYNASADFQTQLSAQLSDWAPAFSVWTFAPSGAAIDTTLVAAPRWLPAGCLQLPLAGAILNKAIGGTPAPFFPSQFSPAYNSCGVHDIDLAIAEATASAVAYELWPRPPLALDGMVAMFGDSCNASYSIHVPAAPTARFLPGRAWVSFAGDLTVYISCNQTIQLTEAFAEGGSALSDSLAISFSNGSLTLDVAPWPHFATVLPAWRDASLPLPSLSDYSVLTHALRTSNSTLSAALHSLLWSPAIFSTLDVIAAVVQEDHFLILCGSMY